MGCQPFAISQVHSPHARPPPQHRPSPGPRFFRLRRDKRKVSPVPFRPIIVIGFKNRSLDEFLCDCLPFTQDVVRIGGRSKTPQLEPYNLRARVQMSKDRRIMKFKVDDKREQLMQVPALWARVPAQFCRWSLSVPITVLAKFEIY